MCDYAGLPSLARRQGSMSEELGERRMDLIGRPSQTMPNGVIIGYLYKR